MLLYGYGDFVTLITQRQNKFRITRLCDNKKRSVVCADLWLVLICPFMSPLVYMNLA